MRYPKLWPLGQRREMLSAFLGMDRTPSAPAGSFYHMENLTSDHFPVLAPRQPRQLYADTNALGLIAGNVIASDGGREHPQVQICYADAKLRRMVVGGQATNLVIDPTCHKWLVSLGAYVLIFPDKKYINTLDVTDFGSMEAVFAATQDIQLSPCDASGGDGEGCVKLAAAGIGKGFSAGDGVQIKNMTQAPHLNGSARICKAEQDLLIIEGALDQPVTQPPGDEDFPVTVKRAVPDMDFVIECGNRLWGCRYGVNEDGQVENRICCCALGDFRNWEVFQGISTDAWSATVGSDGPFTGAVSYRGNPLFFKENCLHKVYMGAAGDHRIVDTACRGVQRGCGKSLATVGETLYYKSPDGVMAYDGAFPRHISQCLGQYRYGGRGDTPVSMHNGQYICAVGGSFGSKYYLSMNDEKGRFHLFVYDTDKDLWHREDGLQLIHACNVGDHLYGINGSGDIWQLDGGQGDKIAWYAITGDLGLDSPDKKYISRLTLRLALEPGSEMGVDAQYDHSGIWEPLCAIYGDRLGSFPLSVQPRRCDHLRLRLRGKGDMKLYSLTKTLSEGSDER